MTMTFDPTKPVRTREGCEAVIVYTTDHPRYPILAVIRTTSDKHQCAVQYTKEGRRWGELPQHETDLVNVPEKHVRWINIYKNREGKFYSGPMGTEPGSDEHAIARRRIEFEEGQFDE